MVSEEKIAREKVSQHLRDAREHNLPLPLNHEPNFDDMAVRIIQEVFELHRPLPVNSEPNFNDQEVGLIQETFANIHDDNTTGGL